MDALMADPRSPLRATYELFFWTSEERQKNGTIRFSKSYSAAADAFEKSCITARSIGKGETMLVGSFIFGPPSGPFFHPMLSVSMAGVG